LCEGSGTGEREGRERGQGSGEIRREEVNEKRREKKRVVNLSISKKGKSKEGSRVRRGLIGNETERADG
jgi:hypothetical protein